MAENETPADQVRSVMTKNLEQAHGAIANYFQFVEKSFHHRRWAQQIGPKHSETT